MFSPQPQRSASVAAVRRYAQLQARVKSVTFYVRALFAACLLALFSYILADNESLLPETWVGDVIYLGVMTLAVICVYDIWTTLWIVIQVTTLPPREIAEMSEQQRKLYGLKNVPTSPFSPRSRTDKGRASSETPSHGQRQSTFQADKLQSPSSHDTSTSSTLRHRASGSVTSNGKLTSRIKPVDEHAERVLSPSKRPQQHLNGMPQSTSAGSFVNPGIYGSPPHGIGSPQYGSLQHMQYAAGQPTFASPTHSMPAHGMPLSPASPYQGVTASLPGQPAMFPSVQPFSPQSSAASILSPPGNMPSYASYGSPPTSPPGFFYQFSRIPFVSAVTAPQEEKPFFQPSNRVSTPRRDVTENLDSLTPREVWGQVREETPAASPEAIETSLVNAQTWLIERILVPLVKEIDYLNATFKRMGIDAQIGSGTLSSLEPLPRLVQSMQPNQAMPEQTQGLVARVLHIHPYLTLTEHQNYYVGRIRMLSKRNRYHWSGGATVRDYNGHDIPYETSFPTDAEILFHCMICYLDDPSILYVSERSHRERKTFSSLHVIQPPETTKDALKRKDRTHTYLYQTKSSPLHINLLLVDEPSSSSPRPRLWQIDQVRLLVSSRCPKSVAGLAAECLAVWCLVWLTLALTLKRLLLPDSIRQQGKDNLFQAVVLFVWVIWKRHNNLVDHFARRNFGKNSLGLSRVLAWVDE